MYRENPHSVGEMMQSGANGERQLLSKLTPLMIKKKIESNYVTMGLNEFEDLNKLLQIDSKLRSL